MKLTDCKVDLIGAFCDTGSSSCSDPWALCGSSSSGDLGTFCGSDSTSCNDPGTFCGSNNNGCSDTGAFCGSCDLWRILASVWLNVRYIPGDDFADHWSRMPHIGITENIKNKQIPAELCKNYHIKTPIDKLWVLNCNQLHQTPIVKSGGRR